MADPSSSDNTLLERLNALKPSSVSLYSPAKSAPASAIEPAKPQSRQDALSDRLKNLREQSSENKIPGAPALEVLRQDGDAIAPSAATRTTQPQLNGKSLDVDTGVLPTSSTLPSDDVDPLLQTDDQTLEELLADLGSDQQWLDGVAAEEEEYQRVTSLLEELGKTSTADQNRMELKARKVQPGSNSDDSEDDNSDGDTMACEADEVLAQAMDETEWEKSNQPPRPELAPPSSAHQVTSNSRDDIHSEPDTANNKDGSSSFDLPAVPLDLQQQPDLTELSGEDADFAASIASRMAALKVSKPAGLSLPSAPTSEVDALGLPVAPSFAPADRPAPGLIKRVGYTDEDQKTWCTVCLEDGAIRCLGCDDDVYCARCWKEMHVGPRAGYEERGHRWETFVRRR
ncbi:hypothetical protein F5X99DRAFT_421637 [Biscogniauxia marginata]|nr:hypothetical protein F5X99DRAFT_421637 [Biscogniauxia marginata]